MRVSRWVWLFTASAGVQAVQTLLHQHFLPYAGTAAMAALLGFAASRDGAADGARRAGLGGLAALTLAAGVVESGDGGYGWPVAFADEPGPLAALLVLLGAGLLSVAVLGRTGRGVRRRRFLPAASAALLVVALLAANVYGGDPTYAVAVLILPVLAVILGLFATNAAMVSGRRWRRAGVGLLPVLALAAVAVGGVASLGIGTPQQSVEQYELCSRTVQVTGADRGEPIVSSYQCLTARADNNAAAQLSARLRTETPAVAIAVARGPDTATVVSSDLYNGGPDLDTLLTAVVAALLLIALAAWVTAMFPS